MLTRRGLFLHTFIAVLLGSSRREPALTSAMKAALDRAILEVYRQAGITADPRTHGRPAPLLRDLAHVLDRDTDPAARDLAARLAPWTVGSFKDLFDGPTTHRPEGYLVVWSLRHLPDELRTVATLLALDHVWRQVDLPGRPRPTRPRRRHRYRSNGNERPAAVSVAAITSAGLPIGGASLTGPGAHAAARGLLTTALLTAASSTQPTQVIITAAALATLLESAPPVAAAVPALTVVTDLQQATELLERHALDRARRTTTTPAGHGAAPSATSTMWPTLILIAQAPADTALAARLAVALLCNHLGINGALLGLWPHGRTWHVDEGGHARREDTTGEDLGRLCVLSPTATTDLLNLIRTAHTDPPAHSNQTSTSIPRPAARDRPPAAAPTPADDTSAHTGLRIQILGPPAVCLTDPAQTPVPIQRSAALQALVYLAVHRDGATTNQLIAALWPGPRPAHAPHRLYTPLAALRTTLREATGADVLLHDEDRYRLNPHHLDVDLWRLHTAAHRVANACAPDQLHHALRSTTALYRGELAQGKTWPWLTIPRETTRRLAIDAYTTLADNEPDPAIRKTLLQSALRVDPANAELQHRAQHRTIHNTS